MYSFPSRSQRRHPFAFFITIGYGSKYFTPAVTPPGRERRARSAYAREAFVRASRSDRGWPFDIRGRIRPLSILSSWSPRGFVRLGLNILRSMGISRDMGESHWPVERSKRRTRRP